PARPAAVDHRLEIATEMSPAPLDPPQVTVRRPAVASGRAREVRAEQVLDDTSPARAGDVEDRHQRGDDHPEPRASLVLTPARLIQMHVLRTGVGTEFVVGRL